MFRFIGLFIVFFSVIAYSVESYSSFTEWNAGAKSLALGRAFTGYADDASALFWNPAGLMQIKNIEIIAQQVMLVEPYGLMYLGVVIPGVESSIGFEMLSLGGGSLDARDEFNREAGSFNDSKMALGVVYSRLLLNNLFLGVKGKYLSRSLGTAADMALAADVSLLYKINENFKVGWMLNNVFGMILGNTSDKLASNSRLGMSYKSKDSVLLLDASNNFSEWQLGYEWSLIDMLPLRIGVNNYELSFGVGLNLGMIRVDFAYVMKELGSNMGFSCNFGFGGNTNAEDEKVSQYLAEATDLLNNAFYYSAKKKLADLLVISPGKVDVVEMIQRIEKILPLINSSEDIEKAAWPIFQEAKKGFAENKFEEAKRLFEEVKKVYPDNRQVKFYLDLLKKKK